MPAFNPVQAFQSAKQNKLAIQQQEQQLAAQPRRNQLADLQLQQAKVGAERGQTQFDQGQALKRAQILNQTAKAFKGLDPSQYASAIASIEPQLEQFGIPRGTFTAEEITPQELDQVIAETQGFISDPQRLSAAQQEFAGLSEGLTDEEKERAKRIKLGLAPRAVGSGTITTATTEGLTEQVAGSEQAIAEGKETGKLEAQAELLPAIRGAIKQAEKEAIAKGETLTGLNRAKAALPGLREVTNKLKSLADIATHTISGKGFDLLAKELSFGATKGATARTTMRAIVDNQVLPLLRDTFGAAFTKAEGDSLRNTLLDPDTAPEQMKATLDAFIEQKVRNIETSERELGQLPQGVSEDDISTTMQIHSMTREQVLERLGGQ